MLVHPSVDQYRLELASHYIVRYSDIVRIIETYFQIERYPLFNLYLIYRI